eukprot:TRINITY_DN1930_c0_g1_i1.p1 TRINITY_DN1930_c0_g1~~TRINITY_DN1930_c0_g1_i1.p1  ORF type:complete len:105 (-),score=18.69 TRINITY_DN1930_c0_g1_i1:77-391(-)
MGCNSSRESSALPNEKSVKKPKPTEQGMKILLLGDSEVGKTSLLLRFAEGQFSTSTTSTIGIDFKTKIVNIGSRAVGVQVVSVCLSCTKTQSYTILKYNIYEIG